MFEIGNLDPKEFEKLAKSVLDCEFNLDFETFPEGKDGGIDLRYSKDKIIVQVKRYNKWSDLKTNLKKEVVKVDKLISDGKILRYIFFTSCKLTPKNKEHVVGLFENINLSNDDIYSFDEINNFLDSSPDILKKHYNLWMKSTEILDWVLNKNSDFYVNNLLNKIKKNKDIYVETTLLGDALSILNEKQIVLITGNAGAGKSTLCEMLIYKIINLNDSKVELTYSAVSNVDEIINSVSFESDNIQIIYIDDLVGKTYIDLRKRELNKINYFLNNYNNSNKKIYLIINSRISILSKFKNEDSNFKQTLDKINDIVIDTNNININEKSNILYKHLKKSSLKNKHLEDIVNNKNYLKIINHKNYNPRVIELSTADNNINNLEEQDNFYNVLTNKLNNPLDIWKSEFDDLKDEEKFVCYLIVSISNKSKILIDEVEKAYNKLVTNVDFLNNPKFNFIEILSNLSKSFINIYDTSNIELCNPSLYDFINNEFKNNITIRNHIRNNLYYFSQINYLLQYEDSINFSEINLKELRSIKSKQTNFINEIINLIDSYKKCHIKLKNELECFISDNEFLIECMPILIKLSAEKNEFYNINYIVNEYISEYFKLNNVWASDKIDLIHFIDKNICEFSLYDIIDEDLIKEIIYEYLDEEKILENLCKEYFRKNFKINEDFSIEEVIGNPIKYKVIINHLDIEDEVLLDTIKDDIIYLHTLFEIDLDFLDKDINEIILDKLVSVIPKFDKNKFFVEEYKNHTKILNESIDLDYDDEIDHRLFKSLITT